MRGKKAWLGLAFVALGCLAVIIATQLPKKVGEKNVAAKGMPHQQNMPNVKDVDKLNTMQAEIAKMADEDIAKETEGIKAKVKQMGIVKPGPASNINLNAHPETKDLLTRMALLRVEKAKRERKQAIGGVVGD